MARMVTSLEERQREEAAREEMRALASCVREVKEGLDKNENKIGEIVVKIDELVILCTTFECLIQIKLNTGQN